MELTLRTCPRWKLMRIVKIKGDANFKARLLSLGFVEGKTCKVQDRLGLDTFMVQGLGGTYVIDAESADTIVVTPA